ncbi:hypothetical protein F4821DRAFT_242756 [Hypoxylon rubiginosum]|uniref:Uncharacterized protein n=1 Tax=Hypoxylon rubiginosum TaxID=110542 RepID=A0ACC0CVD7_9PEZI|nr:hypothetical protein F4821DRAFT_242756 [Hypoxylon rubiginosum]
MCRNCYGTTAASFSPSLAITNPELIWSHQLEQKQRAAAAAQASKAQSQTQSESSQVKPSSASTYSESTTYSYDKDKSQTETTPKRSMRQRLKGVFKDMGNPPTSKYDREHDQETTDRKTDHAPMSSSPISRT